MYNPIEAEARIEKLANKGIDIAAEGGLELTEAIKKLAESEGLNDDEVANVCARANHITWNKVRKNNSLGTFKVANYEEINNDTRKIEDKTEYTPYVNPNSILKVANEVISTDRYDKDTIITAAYTNMDKLNAANDAKSNQIVAMNNTIKQLIQEGETPQDVYEVLRQTWKESTKEELDSFYTDTMETLKAEGSIEGSVDTSIPDSTDVPMEISESKLNKQASVLEAIQHDIINHELAHLKLYTDMHSMGLNKIASNIDNGCSNQMMMLKVAATIAPPKGLSPKDYLVNGLILGGSSLAARAGVAAITKGYTAIKRKNMYNSLRERFPDLQEIPEKQYFDIYESVTNATPALLQTPYILAETIRKPFITGTFTLSDMKTLTDIQAKKDSTDISKELSSAAQTAGKMGIESGIANTKADYADYLKTLQNMEANNLKMDFETWKNNEKAYAEGTGSPWVSGRS